MMGPVLCYYPFFRRQYNTHVSTEVEEVLCLNNKQLTNPLAHARFEGLPMNWGVASRSPHKSNPGSQGYYPVPPTKLLHL